MMLSSSSGVFFGGNAVSFDGRKNAPFVRATAAVTCLFVAWMFFPQGVFAKKVEYKPVSQLAAQGLTQTPDAKLRKKIDAREAAEQASAAKPHADVEPLSLNEMQGLRGRGTFRNPYFNGMMPWQRSFHDVNLCDGNLFKSFTDVQVAPGRGAGLVLQRTYNSNDDRQGPFGTGWTHAYDIRMEEAGTQTDAKTGLTSEIVPRTDFFGGKHKYTRDADGLYSPPAYLYDEMDSRYDASLTDGTIRSLEDSDKGMDGTVKHFIPEGADANGKVTKTRVCDTITDRYGNQIVLTYGQSYTNGDGSTHKLLTQVTDPVGRALTFIWNDFGAGASHAWRIVEVDSPTYRVTYDYYTNAGDTSSYLNLWHVTMDAGGLNRVMTYTYTTCQGETGLLASIADPLGHTVSYTYNTTVSDWQGTNTNPTIGVTGATEPASNGTLHWDFAVRQPGCIGDTVYLQSTFQTRLDTGNMMGEWTRVDQYLRVQDMGLSNGIGGWNEGNSGAGYHIDYDINNNVTGQVSLSNDWTTAFNTTYRPLSFNPTYCTYGPHGNVLTQVGQSVTGYQPTAMVYEYYNADKYFQKKSVTDKLGHKTFFDYFDANDPTLGNRGNVKLVQDAGYGVSGSPSYGKQFTYTYNQYGQKASETNLNGVTTNYTHGDSYGNLTQIVQDPTGVNRVTSMAYDTVGRVKSSTDPNGNTSNFVCNNLGQPVTVSSPATSNTAAETVSYSYGANGRTELVTDGRGTTSMVYEPGNDRVSSVTDPVTGTISYTYLRTGERSSLSLPSGGTITYQYALLSGHPVWAQYGYGIPYMFPRDDPNSIGLKLNRIIDDQGRIVDMKSDSLGHPMFVRYNQTFSGSTLVSYLQTDFRCNRSVPTSRLWTNGWIDSEWTTFRSTASGQQVNNLLYQNDYTYNESGQRLTNTVTTPNAQGQLASRTETYAYDELNRLKTANYGDGENQSYTFDAMGNRTAKTDNVTGNEGYTFDNANRIATRQVGTGATTNYASDANGNTLSDATHTNIWDSQNRLTSCQTSGSGANTSRFMYGADGLRRRMAVTNAGQSVTATITDYAYDGSNVVREFAKDPTTGVASIAATYLMGASGPMYRRPANAADVRWYVYNSLGSVVGEVDVNGVLCCQKTTDVYGISRGNVGTALSRHGFVGGLGHYSDSETGLVYMRARYYDPNVGRFISQDPGRNGCNWYSYADGNPVSNVDVTGKITIDEWNVWIQAWQDVEVGIVSGGASLFYTMESIAGIVAAAGGNPKYLMYLDQEFETLVMNHLLDPIDKDSLSYACYKGDFMVAIATARGYIQGVGAYEKVKEQFENTIGLLLDLL